MARGIFISYRRDDAKHASGRLVERLRQTFSEDQLYLDVDSNDPGIDYKELLSKNLKACKVLLAVIGPSWLTSRDEKGARRLDSPEDLVRTEIEEALTRDIRVIPVLVDGAQMPSEEDLPPTLQSLASRHAVHLTHERFKSDADDLTRSLAKVVAPSRSKLVRTTAIVLALALVVLGGFLLNQKVPLPGELAFRNSGSKYETTAVVREHSDDIFGELHVNEYCVQPPEVFHFKSIKSTARKGARRFTVKFKNDISEIPIDLWEDGTWVLEGQPGSRTLSIPIVQRFNTRRDVESGNRFRSELPLKLKEIPVSSLSKC